MTDLARPPAGPAPTLPTFLGDEHEPLVTPRGQRAQARRQFLKVMAAAGVGIGLAFSDVLAKPLLRVAGADPYEYWDDCQGWINATTVCVPHTAYFGSDNCWTGDQSHFHREGWREWTDLGGDYEGFYTHDGESCSGRNAWIWRGGATTSTQAMCSDGTKQRWWWDGSQWVDQTGVMFSICRTTPPPP